MKKNKWILTCTAVAVCLLTACSKDKPASGTQATRPAPVKQNTIQQTTSSLRVYINNITSYAGDTIDFIGAIQSAENMEINRSMIHVDSSSVDSNTPGTYEAFYTFDYLGTTVIESNKITILENPNAVKPSAAEEPASFPSSEETSVIESASSEEPSSEDTTPDSDKPLSTEPIRATIEQELPNATITLTNGTVASIKCTSSRYIIETYTEESYYEKDGFTFRTSELKILFNTGETQVIETVVTRVQPQTAASE